MRILLLVALCSVAGCIVASTEEVAGAPCASDQDCADPDYVCADALQEGARTCQIAFPPKPGSPDGGGTDAGPGEPAYWCDEVQPLMIKYCAECHGEDRSASGQPSFRLDVYEDLDGGSAAGGLDGAKTKSERIKIRMVDFQNMPTLTYPQQPTDAERDLVRRWVASGAPQCAEAAP